MDAITSDTPAITMQSTGLLLNKYFKIKPVNIPLTICGMVMEKLKSPMNMPIRFAGIALANIEYGIAKILAQAIPIPIIGNIKCFSLLKSINDSNDIPPMNNASACVRFLLNRLANIGNERAKIADTPL